MAELVYLIINSGVLFDIGIAPRYIRLGLVIVIVGYKIFNRILGEEFSELTAKLCGEGFVVG